MHRTAPGFVRFGRTANGSRLKLTKVDLFNLILHFLNPTQILFSLIFT